MIPSSTIKSFRWYSGFFLLTVLQCISGCASDEPYTDLNNNIVASRDTLGYLEIPNKFRGHTLHINKSPFVEEITEVFESRTYQPFMGGPRFSSEIVRDILYDGYTLYIVTGGGSAAIHKYTNGIYEKSFYAEQEGPVNRLSTITSVSPLRFDQGKIKALLVADRNGLQLVLMNEDLEIEKQIFTNLFSSDAVPLQGGDFLVENGSEITSNTGRITMINDNGKIIRNSFPINRSNSFLNIARNNILNVLYDNSIIYHGTYNRKVYTFQDSSFSLKYVIDFGNRNIPSEYLNQPHPNVLEFTDRLSNTDYWHNTGNFIETSQQITFSFRSGEDVFLSVVDKETMLNTHVISELSDTAILKDYKLSNHYLHGPQGAIYGNGSEELYWFIPEIPQDMEIAKNILENSSIESSELEHSTLLNNWERDFRFCIMTAK